jgi:hypothetical protein
MQDATPPDHEVPLFAGGDLADTQKLLRPRWGFRSLDLN